LKNELLLEPTLQPHCESARSLSTCVEETSARLLETLRETPLEEYDDENIEILRKARKHYLKVRDFCATTLAEIDRVLETWDELLEGEPESVDDRYHVNV